MSVKPSQRTKLVYSYQTGSRILSQVCGSSVLSSRLQDTDKVLVTNRGAIPPPPDAATRCAITHRDGGKCCVTGFPGTFWDPLIVVPILLVPTGWETDRVCLDVDDAALASG